jgi:hypothetical protein
MKNIFLDIEQVSLRHAPVSKQNYSLHISASYGAINYDRLALTSVLCTPARAMRNLRN